ncbi:MAG: hypothetical protein JNM78_11485 [Cyclobacteriaceae bacterium]|nr:hypothetical protein [Cyclobacteriaceae bacterium]
MRTSWYNLLFIFFSLPGISKPLDTLDIMSVNGSFSLLNHAYFISTTSTTTIDSIVNSIRSGKEFTMLNKFNFGYNDTTYWIIVRVKNIKLSHERILLEIQNPHIDRLQAYCVEGTRIKKLGLETGDMNLFNTRSIPHRNYVWSLNECGVNDFDLVLRIEKRKSSLNIPAFLWTESAHRISSMRATLFFGICFGMMFVVLIYSLIAGIFLGARVYFFYAFFIFTSIFFLATYEGLSFQLLYPLLKNFNSLFRMLINGFVTLAFVIFSIEFLNIKSYAILLYRMLLVIIIIFSALLIATPFFKTVFITHGLFLIPFILTLSGIANLLLFVSALKLFSRQRLVSLFYLVAYFSIVIAVIISIMEDFGWFEVVPFNPLFIGALIEMLVFAFGISYKIKKVYDKKNLLMRNLHNHQKEMMQSYLQGVEKERMRIAGELHDGVGSRLSNLSRVISVLKSEAVDFVESEIVSLSDEIRNLSHQMMPAVMNYKVLTELVAELIVQAKKISSIEFTFQCYYFPEKLPENQTHELYRIIQEALNNIIKHSRATETDIQLFAHHQELVVSIEDNGIGFDQTIPGGLGLIQMKRRAEALGGKFEINSFKSYGTAILITIPILNIATTSEPAT